jgi:homoserine dehydrogenase
VPIVVLGPGAVGRALIGQILAQRERHRSRLGVRLAVLAVADSRQAVLAAEGEIEDPQLVSLCEAKARGEPLPENGDVLGPDDWLEAVDELADVAPIIVDTSAADTTAVLLGARARDWRLVLANKVPLTGRYSAFAMLTRNGRGARWETTVASALPVIATLQTLLDVGDPVRRIEGTLSGTLGYILSRVDADIAASAAVAEADAMGYLEPDPRTDLSGLDAARKALILARMLGHPLELAALSPDGLYPAEWDELSVDDFRARLPEADAALAARSVAAREEGRVLRYRAVVEDGAVQVGLAALDPRSPLGRAGATDSVVVLTTEHYRANPLVISGRGGGPAVTAAGVLGDILSLVRDGG